MGNISEVRIPKTPIIIAATLQWLRTLQAQIRNIVITIIIAGLKKEKVTSSREIKPRNLALHFGWLFWLHFSGIFQHPGVVAEWWNECTDT